MTPAAEISLLAGLRWYLDRLTSDPGATLEQEQTADATRARISRRQHILCPSAPDLCPSDLEDACVSQISSSPSCSCGC